MREGKTSQTSQSVPERPRNAPGGVVSGPCSESAWGKRMKRSGRDVDHLSPRDGRGRACGGRSVAARRRSGGRRNSPPVHDGDDVRAWFASDVVRETDLWLAVDAAGTLVGIVVLNGRWVDQDQLYVEPTMTGRGIGGALVRLAKRERPDALRLWTFASNTAAQRFYERHGLVATRRTDGRDNEAGAPDIRYVWGRRGDRGTRLLPCTASRSLT